MSTTKNVEQEETLNSAQIKYGDSDVASKRRKSEDDYDTFQREAVENVLNSTAIENEDFKGGSLLSSADISANVYISDKPSDASKGFENTFKILEQDIRTRWNNGQRQTFLRRISEEETEEKEKQFPEQISQRDRSSSPDMLELQLEALQRVKSLMKENDCEEDPMESEEITSPLNESLYGIKVNGTFSQLQSSSVDETIIEQSVKSPEYAYHISKGKDGRKYLKVVKSMLLDKGMFSVSFFFCLAILNKRRDTSNS